MSSSDTRTCRVCGEAKPSSEFYVGQGNTCKKCNNARTRQARRLDPLKYKRDRQAREATPTRAKKRRETRLRRRYKISLSRILEMLIAQTWACAICNAPITYPGIEHPDIPEDAVSGVVDHSHRDGHVRGMLCSACNAGIGLFDDNLRWIKNAFYYLRADLKLSS